MPFGGLSSCSMNRSRSTRSSSYTPRVLYSFPHTLGRVGIGTTALHQIRGLIKAGAAVHVCCTSLADDLDGAAEVMKTMVVRRRRVPHRAIGVFRAYAYHDMRVAHLLQRRPRDFDVVHTWPAGCLRTLRAASQVSIPSFREAPSEYTGAAYARAMAEASAANISLPRKHSHRFNAGRLEREHREFAAADFLLVPSDYVEASFEKAGYEPDKLLRHRYGYDPAHFFPATEVIEGGPLRALFVGRGEPNKGLHLALEAWIASSACSSGTFTICGAILPAYAEKLRPMLEHSSVRLLGFVDDVGSVMREADVLILPSITEGSALVTYEAQASGCVPLVSEAAGAPCRHLEDGLVHEPGDVGTLTEHVRLVDADRSMLRQLRLRGLDNASGLTWDAAGEHLLSLYDEVLSKKAVAA
jgi:D-inositol-3-phosphate glycosyltransferase